MCFEDAWKKNTVHLWNAHCIFFSIRNVHRLLKFAHQLRNISGYCFGVFSHLYALFYRFGEPSHLVLHSRNSSAIPSKHLYPTKLVIGLINSLSISSNQINIYEQRLSLCISVLLSDFLAVSVNMFEMDDIDQIKIRVCFGSLQHHLCQTG